MKNKNWAFNLFKGLLILSFIGYIFYFFYTSFQPALSYHLQQPPFYFLNTFFIQYTDYPGGLSEYAGNFLVQLYHSNLGGSILIAVTVLLIMLCIKYIISSVENGGNGIVAMILSIIPVVILFQNYYFPYYVILKLLFAFAALALFFKFRKKFFLLLVDLIICTILLYYIAGTTALEIYLSSIFLYFIFSKDYKTIQKFGILLLCLIFGLILPYFSYLHIFNIPKERLWLDLIPNLPPVIRYTPQKSLYILILFIPASIFLLGIYTLAKDSIFKKHEQLKNNIDNFSQKIIYRFLLTIVFAFAVYFTFQNFFFEKIDKHRKNIILVDYYVYNEKWDKATEVALADEEYDYFVNLNYNRAIYNSGKFGDWFFKYPQLLGSDGLFPDKITSGQIACPASDFYYELGYIGESLHWAYEAQSVTPYNPRILQRLVKIHLIENQPEAALPYLNILKHCFFQDSFVNKYSAYLKDTSLISTDEEIKGMRSLMPGNILIPGDAYQKFKVLCKYNHTNRRAIEYLCMHYMLSHQLGDFLAHVNELAPFYKKLPAHYQEALLLYMGKTKTIINYPFDKEIINMMNSFFENTRKYSDRSSAQMALYPYYKGTYVYYVSFQSPLITKMQLKSRKVE
jgi:hypothetical protein